MNSSKNKIISWLSRAKQALSFWKRSTTSQEAIDRKLIYGLAARKIPTGRQLKHLPKFLRSQEYLVVKICLLLILINVIYLGIVFTKSHLQYTPKAGGEYVEGIVGYPQTINPLYAASRDVDGDLTRLIYSSLFVYNQDGNLVNDLVESYTISPDNKEYTIKIKNNVRWQNGDSLTADDVVFTFNLIENPDFRSPLRFSFAGVQASSADSQTVKFTLSQPYSPFLDLLTFGVLSKNIWGEVDPSSAGLNNLNLKPVGSGPYQFKSFTRNTAGDLKEYRLVANNNYYNAKPYIKTIVFKFFPDYTQAIKALNDNQIDGLSYVPFSSRADILAQNSLSFHELIQPETVAIFFNKDKNKTLGDKDVRVALAQAINKDQIINEVFNGVYQRLDGPIIPQSWAYNSQLKIYDYSLASATALIVKKPLAVTLTVIDSGQNTAVAQVIKSAWEQAGVKVSLKIVSSAEAPNIIHNHDFEALIYGEAIGGDPDVYAFWHSSQIGSNGLNLAAYSNADVDKLLVDGRSTVDPSQRLTDYQKFQSLITADLPVIWLYSPTYTYVQAKKAQGFSGSVAIRPADRFASVASWYINTHKKIVW